jgi:leader peptidase (prepilin peptidase)/N-methyltransferase
MSASVLLAAALLTLTLVDVATFRLPDLITLPLMIAGLVESLFCGSSLPSRVIGAAVGWAAIFVLAEGFRRLRGRDGIGMGDAKLLAAAGAWLGWQALPWTVLLACGLAFAGVGARLARRGRASLNQPLPFGAPLAGAIWLVWLYGVPPP